MPRAEKTPAQTTDDNIRSAEMTGHGRVIVAISLSLVVCIAAMVGLNYI